MNDPYKVLGIPPSASKEEIKQAFRKQALLHHPDLHVGSSPATKANSESQFRAVNEAYQLLESNNFRYKHANSPGRAGFRRTTNTNPYTSYYDPYSYPKYKYSGFEYFKNRSTSNIRSHIRIFVNSGSLLVTAALSALMLTSILVAEPLVTTYWEERNSGKLFKHIEHDVVQRRKTVEKRKEEDAMARRKKEEEEEEKGDLQQSIAVSSGSSNKNIDTNENDPRKITTEKCIENKP